MSGPSKVGPRLFTEPSEYKKHCNMQIRCHYLLNPPKLIENMYSDKSSCCLCPSSEKKCDLGIEI